MGLLVSDFFTDHIAVERKVGHINVHKPSGPDRLLNLILRDFCSQLSWLVCAIFNALIRAAILPARMKEANLVPKAVRHI